MKRKDLRHDPYINAVAEQIPRLLQLGSGEGVGLRATRIRRRGAFRLLRTLRDVS